MSYISIGLAATTVMATTATADTANNGLTMKHGTMLHPLNHWGTTKQGGDQSKMDFITQDYYFNDTYFLKGGKSGPIFFYTACEAPVEDQLQVPFLNQEVPPLNALAVVAGHRYFGNINPHQGPVRNKTNAYHGVKDCMAGMTTEQQLEDNAQLIVSIKKHYGVPDAPVITLGASYCGMLAGWMRVKYPQLVTGALASSAPVGGFPYQFQNKRLPLSYSAVTITNGLRPKWSDTEHCFDNYRNTLAIINELVRTPHGQALVNQTARQEGSVADIYLSFFENGYGHPFKYYATNCAKGLGTKTYGISMTSTNYKEVRWGLRMGKLELAVDWDKTIGNGDKLTQEDIDTGGFEALLQDFVQIFGPADKVEPHGGDIIPVTQSLVNEELLLPGEGKVAAAEHTEGEEESSWCPPSVRDCPVSDRTSGICTYNKSQLPSEGWGLLEYQTGMNVSSIDLYGLGDDPFWPPGYTTVNQWAKYVTNSTPHFGPLPRDFTLGDIIPKTDVVDPFAPALQPYGLFGVARRVGDWTPFLYNYLTKDQNKTTNIIWSNGLMDPWAGSGLYPHEEFPNMDGDQNVYQTSFDKDSSSISLIFKYGTHGRDLFDDGSEDTVPGFVEGRKIQMGYVQKWIKAKQNENN